MGGFRLIYERKCPFTLYVVDDELIEKVGHTIEQDEEMPVRILVKGADESPEVVKIEISSENNYFLLYEHTSNVFDYDIMRDQQGLHPVFADYLTMLIKLFNQTIN